MPLMTALLGRMAILGGVGLLQTALFYAVMVPPAIAFFKGSVLAWDTMVQTAPLFIQRAYYLTGLNIALQMFTTSFLAGLTARLTSGVFRKALSVVK